MGDPFDEILNKVAQGEMNPEAASKQLQQLLHQDLGFATIDHDRLRRCGSTEVIYGLSKTPDQVSAISEKLIERNGFALVTRATPQTFDVIQNRFDAVEGDGQTILIGQSPQTSGSSIPIITAGTSDQPVATEALLTLV